MTLHARDFLDWATRPTPDSTVFRPEYATLTGQNLDAALVLGRIVDWHLPDEKGEAKLRVAKQGGWWIADTREAWCAALGITKARQFDRALKVLVEQGLVEKRVFKFRGYPTLHVRLLEDTFLARWRAVNRRGA